jgi:hypothetical protein
MKLLLDQNLSPRLAEWLQQVGSVTSLAVERSCLQAYCRPSRFQHESTAGSVPGGLQVLTLSD